MADRQKIYVLDEDPAIRQELYALLTAANFYVKTFATTAEFLADKAPKEGCLIADVRTPNWLEFRMEIARRKYDLAVLVISGHADIPMVIGVLRTIAIDFIEKPLNREQVIAAVHRALAIRASVHDELTETASAKQSLARLTARELAVARELVEGRSNKEAAARLKISPRTIELHRANILKKLKIAGISPLVRLMIAAQALEIGDRTGPGAQPEVPRQEGLSLIAGGKAAD